MVQIADHLRCLHTKGKNQEVVEILPDEQGCEINGKAEIK